MWHNVGAAELKATLQLLVIYWLQESGTMSVGDTFKNSLRNPISKKELKNPISNPRFQKLKTKEGFDLPATAEQRSMHDQNSRSNPRACTIKTHDQNPFQFANRSPFRNYHSWTEEEQLLATCFLDSDLKLKVSSKAHCRPTIKPSSTICHNWTEEEQMRLSSSARICHGCLKWSPL